MFGSIDESEYTSSYTGTLTVSGVVLATPSSTATGCISTGSETVSGVAFPINSFISPIAADVFCSLAIAANAACNSSSVNPSGILNPPYFL